MSTTRLLEPQRQRIGAGFQAEGWREPLALLDPFIRVDHFRMTEARSPRTRMPASAAAPCMNPSCTTAPSS